MRTILLVAAAALFLAACNKPQPSLEFSRARSLHGTLNAKLGEDAYLDPKMTEVETLLSQVPQDSLDFAAATELSKHIKSERERVTREAQERDAALAEALKPPEFPPEPAVEQPVQPTVEDPAEPAPPSMPVRGMPLKEFLERFSDCFRPGQQIEVDKHGTMASYALRDSALCRDKYPGFSDKLVLADKDTLFEPIPKSSLVFEWRAADGGVGDAGR